jgi:Tol biopolymer transport system component
MRYKLPFLGIATASLILVAGGATASPGGTTRVSVDSAGNEANDNSGHPSISADGRFVAFQSQASNLVPGDTAVCIRISDLQVANCQDIYVHDRQTGRTERVNVDSAGNQADGWSKSPDISADGRFIVFESTASNLVPGDTSVCNLPDGTPLSCSDIFVHDRKTGETTRVSVSSGGAQGDGPSDQAVISDDGRYVAFLSTASNLVPGDTNGQRDVFRHDLQTGETVRVNVSNSRAEANGWSYHVTISADGRYVGFSSDASNLVDPPENEMDMDAFLWDSVTGQVELISTPSGTVVGVFQYGEAPFVSDDGRWAVFSSGLPDLVPNDTNWVEDVFLRDRLRGETQRISLTTDGKELDSASFVTGITPNGRFAVYHSSSAGIVADDTNDREDVFVWDRATGRTVRVSVDSAGNQGNNHSQLADISASGAAVAYESYATNLVPGDTNGEGDIFANERAVEPLTTATPSPPTATPPLPTATPLPAEVVAPPTGDGGSSADDGISLAVLVAAGGALLLAAGGWYARRRRRVG